MITLDQLTYAYRKGTEALTNASASIGGGVYLLLGENGAGKTTLLHVIAGLLYPTLGRCLLDGEPMSLRRPEEMTRVFFLGDNMEFPACSIEEMTEIHAIFYPRFDPDMLRRNLAQFGLTGKERLDKLSLGNRHKSQVAYALSLCADLLLLDEPANGLDISSRATLQAMFAGSVGPEQTVIVSTHVIADLQNLYDGVIILSHGQIKLADTIDALLERVAFTVSPIPPVNAIYSERRLVTFHSIVKAGSIPESADVDYLLLFNAIHNNKTL